MVSHRDLPSSSVGAAEGGVCIPWPQASRSGFKMLYGLEEEGNREEKEEEVEEEEEGKEGRDR